MPEEKQKEETAIAVAQPRYPMREMLATLKEMNDPELFKAFAHDIIEREVASARFGQDWQLARVFASSGAFDGIQGTEQGVALAMTKIQLGRSWNMETADAMKSVFFINGRPSVESVYLAAQMQNAGLGWDLEWDEVDGTCTGCHLHLKRWNPAAKRFDPVMGKVNGVDKQAVVSFTKKDADNAWIYENGKKIRLSEKFNYQSWGQDMFYARCISRVRTRYMPNVLSGVMTREEAEDAGTPEIKALPERAQLTAASFTPSTEQNRGHDAVSEAQPARARKPREEKPAEPKPEPKAETKSEAQPDPAAVTALPWRNEADMKQVLNVHKIRVGPKAYSETLAALNATTGDLQWTGGVSVQFYQALKALPEEKEETAATTAQPKQATLDQDDF